MSPCFYCCYFEEEGKEIGTFSIAFSKSTAVAKTDFSIRFGITYRFKRELIKNFRVKNAAVNHLPREV